MCERMVGCWGNGPVWCSILVLQLRCEQGSCSIIYGSWVSKRILILRDRIPNFGPLQLQITTTILGSLSPLKTTLWPWVHLDTHPVRSSTCSVLGTFDAGFVGSPCCICQITLSHCTNRVMTHRRSQRVLITFISLAISSAINFGHQFGHQLTISSA